MIISMYFRRVFDGTWRPYVVAGMVVAIAIGMGLVNRSEVNAASVDQPAAMARTLTPSLKVKPTPEPVSAPVAETDAVGTLRLTRTDGRTVALTFDDGPHPKYTPEILAILGDYGVRATFCVLGQQTDRNPALVARIADDGHLLCNHTTDHDTSLRQRNDGAIAEDLRDAAKAIKAAAPEAEIPFFRAPGGYFAANVNVIAGSFEMTPLGWSIDTQDWRRPAADAIHDTVIDAIHPGAIVLLHDGGGDRSATVEALPMIIESLRNRGYQFVVPVP
jgi:peptidoglycan/xylan/chitin deacetylase (PgdA/CDA1 family)